MEMALTVQTEMSAKLRKTNATNLPFVQTQLEATRYFIFKTYIQIRPDKIQNLKTKLSVLNKIKYIIAQYKVQYHVKYNYACRFQVPGFKTFLILV